jgi:hypothetical protein
MMRLPMRHGLLRVVSLEQAIFGQLISNTATALIVIPIAISAAGELGISPRSCFVIAMWLVPVFWSLDHSLRDLRYSATTTRSLAVSGGPALNLAIEPLPTDPDGAGRGGRLCPCRETNVLVSRWPS